MTTQVTVFVADDHPVFRDGLTRAVSQRPDLTLVGDAADGRAALTQIRALQPDVALLDVKMPLLDGIQVLAALTRDQHPTKVVLLSAEISPESVYAALAAGAAAFIGKDSDRSEICDAVAAAARGETRLSLEVQNLLVSNIRRQARDELPTLTLREREVLKAIAEGFSAPAIAERLALSPATVKTHLQTLYRKLGVSERAAAVAKAIRIGLLD
jgi:two-component system, NarL family, nitrate/nitrite response regulator NarL